ncbi:MAG: SPOR domain-containing protein, partial [Ignavibacteria bacterium]|nr:SPOR domain-containing protein [Ignavibacteria bacterium]
ISSIEKLEGVIGEEEIIFEKSQLSKRKIDILKSESLTDETPIKGEDTFPSAEDIRNREFKFGKNISNQIKNKVTPEPGQEAKPNIGMDASDSEKLPWNFGREVFDKKVEYKREDSKDVPHENETDEEKDIQEIESGNLSDELIETDKDETETSSIIDEEMDYRTGQEEVRTAKEIEHDEKLNSVIDDFITKDAPEKFDTYERVKSSVSNIKKDKIIDKPGIEESEEKIEPELAEIVEETNADGFMEVQSKSSVYHLEDKKVKTKKEKETVPIKKSIREDRYLYKRKRRNMVPLLVGFFAIVFVAAIVYLYLESDTIFKSEEVDENILPIVRPTSVTVIEREYAYPITFPYAVSLTDDEISGLNLAFISDEEIVFEPPVTKQEIDKEEEESTVAVKDEKISGEESIGLVSKHVYKYKDYYVVQVASFKSYSIAEEEAKKYKEMGYNTFVEIAEITDTGTWFRLRVGDFTTREKANGFASKYIK